MTPLSVVTGVAAGPKQKRAETRLVHWPHSWQRATYRSQSPLLTSSACQSPTVIAVPPPLKVPGLPPSLHAPPSLLPLVLWPHIPAPGREEAREDFRSWLDTDHVWMIHFMCVEMVCLNPFRGLGPKS